jgi:hypothetical protein
MIGPYCTLFNMKTMKFRTVGESNTEAEQRMKSSSSLPRSVFSLLNVLGETVPLWRGHRISVGRDWGCDGTASQSNSLPALSRYLRPVTNLLYTYDPHRRLVRPWMVADSRFMVTFTGTLRLNIELDLQSLFGLLSRDRHSCTHWLRPLSSPPPSAFGLVYEGAIGQPR